MEVRRSSRGGRIRTPGERVTSQTLHYPEVTQPVFMGRRSQVLRQETANLRSVVKFHPPPPPPHSTPPFGAAYSSFLLLILKKTGQCHPRDETAPIVLSKVGDFKASFGCSKSGAILRPDPLVPCPVGGPMTGPMTDRAAGACLGILTQAGRSARSGANGGIRAGPDGGIRPRADGCPRARAGSSACPATAPGPGPGSRSTAGPGTSTPQRQRRHRPLPRQHLRRHRRPQQKVVRSP